MHASHRTWRGLVTAPPQSGQVHSGNAPVGCYGYDLDTHREALLSTWQPSRN